MGSTLLVETRDQVRWLTLNRPERRNALDREIMAALREAIVKGGDDPAVRVLVVTGAGGAFSAGADLKANREVPTQEDVLEVYYNPVIRAIRHAKKPIIAAVDGVAAGYGCSLALACDVRLASRTRPAVADLRQDRPRARRWSELLPAALGRVARPRAGTDRATWSRPRRRSASAW